MHVSGSPVIPLEQSPMQTAAGGPGPVQVEGISKQFRQGSSTVEALRDVSLSIADGEGRNGIWLAEQGLDVLALDFSPAAQAKAHALAKARGVSLRIELADVHAA